MINEAIFEAPAHHEGAGASFEDETFESWEQPEASGYESWESLGEDESFETFESFEGLGEDESFETFESFEGLGEDESFEALESFEDEDPFLGNVLGAVGSAFGLGEDEWYEGLGEDESFEALGEDMFFGKIAKFASRMAKKVSPIARLLAPIAAKAVGSLVPGGSLLSGPLAKMAMSALREGDREANALEAQVMSRPDGEFGTFEAADEMGLQEVLAHESVRARTGTEATTLLATSLPITITIMRARRATRPVVPVLAQANNRLVRSMWSRGPAGRQLLVTVPTIQRRTIATLKAADRRGQPITAPLAVAAMSAATRQVLSDPRRVRRAIERNAVLVRRTTPMVARRSRPVGPMRPTPYNPRRRAYR